LISLEDFKAVLGIDDRDDKLSRFCLTTATYTIEQYCMRRLLRKKHFERIQFTDDLILPLKEYPVKNVLAVYAIKNGKLEISNEEIIEPDFYCTIPDCDTFEDIPFCLSLSRALLRYKGLAAIKIIYWAGYSQNNVPPDLTSACLELAAWNMNRYKSRKIGTTGNIRGSGKDGEHFELSMPENVKALLEPYRRKTI
jgi:hypothetical protein